MLQRNLAIKYWVLAEQATILQRNLAIKYRVLAEQTTIKPLTQYVL
jgi:hypothetical protein